MIPTPASSSRPMSVAGIVILSMILAIVTDYRTLDAQPSEVRRAGSRPRMTEVSEDNAVTHDTDAEPAGRLLSRLRARNSLPGACGAVPAAALCWRCLATALGSHRQAGSVLRPRQGGRARQAGPRHGRPQDGKVTLVNVFASWCVPCRQEQAALLLLSQTGQRIVGIAYKDQPANTRRFLGQDGDPYQAVVPT